MKKTPFFLCMIFLSFSLFAESRNALLIANDRYSSLLGSLSNPVKEAKNLKKTLEKLGFTVTLLENADIGEMEKNVEKFGILLREKKGIGFFHYGGHAIQVSGKNFLIPAKTEISTESQIKRLSLDLDDVMSNMQAETNIVILDACRNNPLPSSTRGAATRGLALTIEKPRNSIIVYSAEPGKTAQDGIFTPILTEKLLEQKSLISILTDVRREVNQKTKGEQTPKNDDGLMNEVFLAGLSPDMSIIPKSKPMSVELIDHQGRHLGEAMPNWVLELFMPNCSREKIDGLLDTKNKLVFIASCTGEDMASVVEWLNLLNPGIEFAASSSGDVRRKISAKQHRLFLPVYDDLVFSNWKRFKSFWYAVNNKGKIEYTYLCVWTRDIDETFYLRLNSALKKHKLENENERSIVENSLLTLHIVSQTLNAR